jgi:hypothetical protein
MSKRIIKGERIKAIIHDIAEDFRFSHETGEYALLFYKADTQGVVIPSTPNNKYGTLFALKEDG